MSQITRCPSCATKFKVVADQLRISDGWVRCGHCKEVFDASAHLLPFEPQVLLPDISMTAARPPQAPAARVVERERSWGAAPPQVAPSEVSAPAAHEVLRDPAVPESVLDIPVAAVPSFLVPGALDAEPQVTGVPWRSIALPESEFTPEPEPERDPDGEPDGEPEVSSHAQPLAQQQPPTNTSPGEASTPAGSGVAPVDEGMAGYGLPFAELRDDQWPDEPHGVSVVSGSGNLYHPLDLPRKDALGTPAPLAAHGDWDIPSASEEVVEAAPDARTGEDLALDGEVHPAAFAHDVDAQPPQAAKVVPRERIEDDDGFDDSPDAQELGFVRAARRKAFWRRPRVRVVMAAVVALLLGLLALQGTLHERDRIAAFEPGARAWLEKLCEALQCTLAPLRQISDVVIDSSSFNKGRGDSYQLAFVIKNRATVSLAMPAMELTLTDAQDQPVVRRVLLPQEMAAPAELPASGEWTSSVAVVVTTGGARVAGYRLLAFYP